MIVGQMHLPQAPDPRTEAGHSTVATVATVCATVARFDPLADLAALIRVGAESGDPGAVRAAEALAAEQRLGLVVEPQILRGAILTAQGAFEEAVACLREGLAGGPKVTRVRSYGLAELAEALSRQGGHGAALAAAREGLRTQEETGHCQWHAELHRLEGIALVGLNRLKRSRRGAAHRA
jgi:hypothetical protein